MVKKNKKQKLTEKQVNYIYYGAIFVVLGFVFTMAYISFEPVIDWNNSLKNNRSLFD